MGKSKDIRHNLREKCDSRKNGDKVFEKLREAKERDKGKVPLRIDNKTIIMVNKEKATEKYAAYYREKYIETINIIADE